MSVKSPDCSRGDEENGRGRGPILDNYRKDDLVKWNLPFVLVVGIAFQVWAIWRGSG